MPFLKVVGRDRGDAWTELLKSVGQLLLGQVPAKPCGKGWACGPGETGMFLASPLLSLWLQQHVGSHLP